MTFTIEPALPADADAIADVHVRSWAIAYRGQIPDELLDYRTIEVRAGQWRAWFDAPPPQSGMYVAKLGGEVVGFVDYGPCRDEDARPDWGEAYALYLVGEAWGTGMGRALFERATADLIAAGFTHLSLWVLDTNARARRFYKIADWHADGAEKVEVRAGFAMRELRYSRLL